jgi:ribosomal protein L11 methyltransferase
MAFGTGHHATTRCMMRQMQNIDFSGKVVLDMGTGTGILAILAEKLGAEGVLAADYDEIAVDNTLENLELNYTKKIDAEQYSHPDEIHEEFDIILANINRNVLLDHLEGYSNIIVPQGILLLSGFYEQDTNILIEKAKQCGFKHIETIHENEWFCLKFEKN